MDAAQAGNLWLKQCNGDETSINSLSMLMMEQKAEAGDGKNNSECKTCRIKLIPLFRYLLSGSPRKSSCCSPTIMPLH